VIKIKILNCNFVKKMFFSIHEIHKLICSISNEPFIADITIEYESDGNFIELVSLRKYIKESFKKETIESICCNLKSTLSLILHQDVKVCVKGESKIHPTETVWL
jgi:NADPH-dependent 7-cyano-7-deazaguanine reductase QueF